jgi:HNH endonuclease
MRFICPQGCVTDVGMSHPHPGECPGHGPFRYEKALRRSTPLRRVSEKRASSGRPRGTTLKRGRGFAASKAQREKVKGMPCAGCGHGEVNCDPAHIWPRGKGGCDAPECVIPLCRSCHRLFDDGELDLLERLAGSEAWAAEQAHPILAHGVSLVELVRRLSGGGYEFIRLSDPSDHPIEQEEARC